MDRQIERHLGKRGIRLAHGRQTDGLLGTDGGISAFLRWFYVDVMMFDSLEYRWQFWREASRRGHTIGDMPRTAIEFTDPRLHPYGQWFGNLLFMMLAMGVSTVVWVLVRTVDTHIRRLRRPTYYEAERSRRLELAAARRRIRKRTTTNSCPTPDMLRTAFACALETTANMIKFGSMLEDLECYVDNSVVWSGTTGRIVGRRGGIRQWLRENVPDLSDRYKTIMKYKAIAKRFRQAVGVHDPVPATAVLPSNMPDGFYVQPEGGKGKLDEQEYCSEQSRETGDKMTMHGHGSKQLNKKLPEALARNLLEKCEGTLASLSAQLALMVSEDFVPCENIARTKIVSARSKRYTTRQERSSA